jgi:uncharacterized membrane protein
MADPVYVLLRILHVGSAVFLVGGATLWGAIVVPTLAQMGPTLPKGLMPTLGKKIVNAIPHAALLTFLTGLGVYGSLGGFAPGVASTPWGMLISLALLLTLVILVIAYGVTRPTFRKFTQVMMSAQGPPPPEAQQLLAKMTLMGKANLALGWIIVLLMVLATSHAV